MAARATVDVEFGHGTRAEVFDLPTGEHRVTCHAERALTEPEPGRAGTARPTASPGSCRENSSSSGTRAGRSKPSSGTSTSDCPMWSVPPPTPSTPCSPAKASAATSRTSASPCPGSSTSPRATPPSTRPASPPRQTLLRISTGRDTADTAFLATLGGELGFLGSTVFATTEAALPADDGSGPVVLG